MISIRLIGILLLGLTLPASAGVFIDEEAFGEALGGWEEKKNHSAEYQISGSDYRTYKPVATPTPNGGIFVSVRIDHVRGWLAADDHASLEITIDADGYIESAQSNVAIQGRSISSDLIRSGNNAGQRLTGVDNAVKIGADLVADMSAKLLREKIVEAGRVSYPAVIRHNYNHLFQSIRVTAPPIRPLIIQPPVPFEKADQPAPPCQDHPQPLIIPYKPETHEKITPPRPEASPKGSVPETRN